MLIVGFLVPHDMSFCRLTLLLQSMLQIKSSAVEAAEPRSPCTGQDKIVVNIVQDPLTASTAATDSAAMGNTIAGVKRRYRLTPGILEMVHRHQTLRRAG